jgi:hypothetical protein
MSWDRITDDILNEISLKYSEEQLNAKASALKEDELEYETRKIVAESCLISIEEAIEELSQDIKDYLIYRKVVQLFIEGRKIECVKHKEDKAIELTENNFSDITYFIEDYDFYLCEETETYYQSLEDAKHLLHKELIDTRPGYESNYRNRVVAVGDEIVTVLVNEIVYDNVSYETLAKHFRLKENKEKLVKTKEERKEIKG